jgi:hypothetical protein
MKKITLAATLLGTILVPLLQATPAQAQATRTWVSGVGDDVNPCSRTAPCKTFAGAISKTFINGEINCLDPGGFGTINITKSMTIDCTFAQGSILASGVNGVTVNIAAGNVNDPLRSVRLRGLSINGAGASGAIGTRTGINGINILAGSAVYVEDVVISEFGTRGISDTRTGSNDRLFVKRVSVRDNTGPGIRVVPSAGTATVGVIIDETHVLGNGFGIVVANGPRATITRSVMSGNGSHGVDAEGASEVNVDGSSITNNGSGLFQSAPAVLRISNNNVFNNVTGVSGNVSSFSNNRFAANGVGGAITPIGAANTNPSGQQ